MVKTVQVQYITIQLDYCKAIKYLNNDKYKLINSLILQFELYKYHAYSYFQKQFWTNSIIEVITNKNTLPKTILRIIKLLKLLSLRFLALVE